MIDKPEEDLEQIVHVNRPPLLSDAGAFAQGLLGEKPESEPIQMTLREYKQIKNTMLGVAIAGLTLLGSIAYVDSVVRYGSLGNAYQAVMESNEKAPWQFTH